MTEQLVLYCPDLPPVPGGVADHTLALGRALGALGVNVAVLGRQGDPGRFTPIPSRIGVTHRRGERGLRRACQDLGARAVLFQYVPFLYARHGIAPALVRTARALRAEGVRLGILIHEPWVPPTRLAWRITGPLMRRQLLGLVALSDAVWSPVPDFLERVRPAIRAGAESGVVPIGSTIPVVPHEGVAARLKLDLAPSDVAIGVFSPGASGAAPEWVARAARALGGGPAVRWVVFGNGSERFPTDFGPHGRVQRLGRLDAADVSRTFQALDLALAPYTDGLSLRRTAAMAALAHGVPLLSSQGPLFDPALGEAAECSASADDFAADLAALVRDPRRRTELGRRGAEFFAAHASVEVLAARVAAWFGMGP